MKHYSNKIKENIICFYFLIYFFTNVSIAFAIDKKIDKTFCSTKFSKVSVKSAPKHNSVVKLIFLHKNEPVQIIATFDNWRKILDVQNDSGWIHISCLSEKRFVIVCKKEKVLYKKASVTAGVIAKLKPGVRCKIEKQISGWVKISIQNYTGWVTNKDLWGI